jgi:transposase-like protein
VALEAIHGVKTLNEIAREFGVHPVQVGKWKQELQEQASSLFEVKRGPKPLDPAADPEKLYTEIGRLKVELEWLKKSRGFPDDGAKSVDRRKRSAAGGEPVRIGRNQSLDLLCAAGQ